MNQEDGGETWRTTPISVTKLEAAQRQLHCAIELWFQDADLISIHTLARAAYDIIHDLNEHEGMPRDLLYNSDHIKDEYQRKWADTIRKPGNFAKHADRDPDAVMQFDSFTTLGFIMYAIRGLASLGISPSHHTNALGFWLALHDPKIVKPEFREFVTARFSTENIAEIRTVPKADFFDGFLLIFAPDCIPPRSA